MFPLKKYPNEAFDRTTVDKNLSLLQATVESTADGILVVDTNGKIVLFNEKFAKLWKIPKEILESNDDSKALSVVLDQLKNQDAFIKRVQELYAAPEKESYDTLEFRDGRTFERYSQPQWLDGKIIGRVWSFRDITEKTHTEKALQKANNELQTVLLSISDYIWSARIDINGSITNRFYSAAVRKITGRPPEFYMESPNKWLSTIHLDDVPPVLAAFERLKSRRSHHEVVEYRVILPDGNLRTVRDNVIATPLEDGELRLDGVVTDITDQKLLEENKQRLLTHESRLRLEAEKNVHTRDLFISIASHELKSPLTSLKMRISLLNKALTQNDEKSSQRLIKCCMSDVDQLANLIDALLDASKISMEPPTLYRKTFCLNELLKELLERRAPDFEQGKCPLRVAIEEEITGLWDKIRLEQVINNLISNSIKYAKGKMIEIGLRKKSNMAQIQVKDHGMGIPPEYLPKIFEPFTRAVSAKDYKGMGLGLYVSDQIVKAHGGKISVESELGKGTVFTVEVPIQANV